MLALGLGRMWRAAGTEAAALSTVQRLRPSSSRLAGTSGLQRLGSMYQPQTRLLTSTVDGSKSVVEWGDKVKITYTGVDPETRESLDALPEGREFEFVIGTRRAMAGIEVALLGMHVGDTKTVTLSPVEAFGEYNDGMEAQVPRSMLPDDIEEGHSVRYEDGQIATVVALQDDTALLDLNHPLAGRSIEYTLNLLGVWAVPQMEIIRDSPGNQKDFPQIDDIVTIRVDVFEEDKPENLLGGGSSPLQFRVGEGHMYLPGIDDVVLEMSLSEKVRVRVPHELGYFGPERKSTIVYKVDLLEIGKKVDE